MSSPVTDPGHGLPDGPSLLAALATGTRWQEVRVVAESGSTNAELAAQARAGAADGLVLVAERQSAGRGRRDRTWNAPPGSGLTFSALLRPGESLPVARWGWVPLAAGLAVLGAVRAEAGVTARLKWPNDVLSGEGGKLAGVLTERIDDGGLTPAARPGCAVVVGIGINVDFGAPGPPVAGATDLVLAGAVEPDRSRVLLGVLERLSEWLGAWIGAGADAEAAGLAAAYRNECATIGAAVRAHLPDGSVCAGAGTDIDRDGRLVVLTDTGPRSVTAGDVVHVR